MRDACLPDKKRWALLIEYDGTNYVGWQRQKTDIAVQELLEEAASKLVKGKYVHSVASGRTDSGVHACAMPVHLDFPVDAKLCERNVIDGINYHLKPHRIVVLKAVPAPQGWHARFSSLWRRYEYHLLTRRARPALMEGKVWHFPFSLDVKAMQNAAQHLLGQHDFTTFRASACQALSPIKTLDQLDIIQENDLIRIITKSRSFLHHQVRNMVGTLTLVGRGQWSENDLIRALEAKDRAAGGQTAPPEGLFFMEAGYKENLFS
ncbi:tRNA pseudouridine(38-40) synthase TruA [Acetobacteraceae bacterium]|nr:tRNA pseudouridine(38-40) synthase TruA [Acetobacteraceae bacterium]